MKKLRFETTLLMALMATQKKEREKRSVASSHGMATTLKKLQRVKLTLP
jgi:hypothetical protein